MEQEKLAAGKMYELVLASKQHTEDRSDKINQYYTSLLATIVSVVPFIDRIAKAAAADTYSAQNIRIVVSLLAFVAFILSISWVQTLKRLYYYTEAIDKLLVSLEKEYNQPFITYVSNYLAKTDSPDRVTKQSMWVPYTFSTIFLIILIYTTVGYLF